MKIYVILGRLTETSGMDTVELQGTYSSEQRARRKLEQIKRDVTLKFWKTYHSQPKVEDDEDSQGNIVCGFYVDDEKGYASYYGYIAECELDK